MAQPDTTRSAATTSPPLLVGDFHWHGIDWWVVYWPDESEFDVVREETPYTWRGSEIDERDR